MPIKLIKVTRDLNVGLTTVVDFLHTKGFQVESNPNTKIADDQYALLIDEFGKGLSDAERKRLLGIKQENIVPVKAEEKEKEETPKEEPLEEIKIEVPEAFIPKFVTKGKIDLASLQPKKESSKEKVFKQDEVIVESPKTVEEINIVEEVIADTVIMEKQEEIVAAEEQTKPVEAEIAEEPKEPVTEELPSTANTKSDEEEIFRLSQPKIEPTIKVTGKIDLSTINQSTRPKKKTKEEKKKEREEKRKVIEVKNQPSPPKPKPIVQSNDAAKKKRKRIKKDKVDINTMQGTNHRFNRNDARKPRLKKPVKAEVSEEDVQKQIKETLARLTNKGNKSSKGAKYRRDKRDAAERREQELQLQEEKQSKVLQITEFVTANDLANMMNISVSEIISTCMSIGMMVSINQRLDAETINIVAEEFGFKTEYVSADVTETIKEEEDNPEDYVSRPPIVTVMGHVDHGKTSLLDNIRNANVIAGEAGGITQHIGAYNVKLQNGRRITFLDTPGHEAFTAMRARGAKVTDIVIIIVAADDNVMPQTIEAINHASAASVPIVFAINKIDKPGANPEKIKEVLSQMNYLVEDWGGKYQSQEISAKKGTGVQELLEKVLLEADLLELKANPNKRATASVIESTLDKGRGYVATVLVSNGTLKQGDVALAGTQFGRVKAMFNERNQRVEKAGPSEPVLILGLNGAPQAGDMLNVLETEQEAREIATRREQLQRELGLRTQKRFGLEELGRRRALGDFHELNLIVKGDVDGSVEALSDSLINLSTEEIQVNVIHKAVGQISESDVDLAASSDAIIIGFQVRPAQTARRKADKEGVEIRQYSIIYDAIEEVKAAMEGMLSPEIKEEVVGNVEVLQVFKITKVGTVAGCLVKEGKVKRINKVRVIRDGIVIHTGDLGSLKRFKDEVKEVYSGQDCGIFISNYNNIQTGDIIEAFDQIEVKKTL
ncbi:MAG: translation initiation factor IF-2 [Tannerella sp.]|jgi:translation initiation factor IF-2|nr:translation initiation factor IF-2 [Tannerella sp.]